MKFFEYFALQRGVFSNPFVFIITGTIMCVFGAFLVIALIGVLASIFSAA